MLQQRCGQSEERQTIFRGRVEHAGRTDGGGRSFCCLSGMRAAGGGLFYKRVNLDHDLARLTRGGDEGGGGGKGRLKGEAASSHAATSTQINIVLKAVQTTLKISHSFEILERRRPVVPF